MKIQKNLMRGSSYEKIEKICKNPINFRSFTFMCARNFAWAYFWA